MKKRYQIFVSSTYKDLIEERLIVKKAILEMKHFPAGMEEFPALDKPQIVFLIKLCLNGLRRNEELRNSKDLRK